MLTILSESRGTYTNSHQLAVEESFHLDSSVNILTIGLNKTIKFLKNDLISWIAKGEQCSFKKIKKLPQVDIQALCPTHLIIKLFYFP